MLRPVIKVARANEDLNNAPVYRRTLDSSKNHLKIKTKGYGSLVIPYFAGTGISRKYIVIPHNLGYKPFVDVFVRDLGDTSWKKTPCNLAHDTVGLILGDYESVICFYVWDIFSPAIAEHTVEYMYLIYVDPSKDAWYA